MQRYRGIVMGRRKKNNSETEAEMEGSGDDHEPQGLALLVVEFGHPKNVQDPPSKQQPPTMFFFFYLHTCNDPKPNSFLESLTNTNLLIY